MEQIVQASLMTFFCIIVMKKWGVIDLLINSKYEILQKLGSCPFCMSFWVSLPICFGLFPYNFFLVPCATSISFIILILMYD